MSITDVALELHRRPGVFDTLMARYALPDLEYDFGALEFFKAVWNLRDWDDVSARFEAARTVDLRVPEAVAKSGRARPA